MFIKGKVFMMIFVIYTCTIIRYKKNKINICTLQ